MDSRRTKFPRWPGPGFTRHAAAALFLACGLSLAASPWPDPVANDVLPYEVAGLTHGPMLGRPAATSMRVWVRTAQPTRFEVVYGTAIPINGASPAVAGETTAARDNTGAVDLAGLAPDMRYFYGVRIAGQLADTRPEFHGPWPSFRTLPDEKSCADPKHNPRGLFNVCFAIGHCASQEPATISGGHYASPPAYDTLRREHGEEAMFAIVNGDIIYEELRDGTADGVRANYRLYYSRGRSFASLFRGMPGLFTFDDHDVGWDIHGCGEVGLGEGPHLIRDIGLAAYQEYAGWANFTGPQSGAVRIGRAEVKAGDDILFDAGADFSGLRPETVSTIHVEPYTRDAKSHKRADAPPNAGVYGLAEIVDRQRLRVRPALKRDAVVDYSIGTHHYYDWKVANCHFFALDTRGERTRYNAKDRTDAKTFILGEAQRRWLLEGVKDTDAQFIFLISPDPWVIYHTAAHVSTKPGADRDDKGDGFPSFIHEREQLIEALDALGKPVLIFTGDVHHSASVRVTHNVWEMMCGPLSSTGHPLGTLGNPPLGGTWDSQGRQVQIRWLSAFPNNMPYQRIRNAYYGIVQVNNVARVGKPDGPGDQWVAYGEPQVIVRWHDAYTGKLAYAETVSTMDARKP
ncbi:MAG: alkaline phosphatase D family protein [Verrucomicrobiae bacterium]|nr:alkaline phosphatase D family protein [Verrucomicrobiae bacterium]